MVNRIFVMLLTLFSYTMINAQSMAKEAEEFISDLPSGLQDKQERAVRAAINGDYSALNEVRNTRNVPSELPVGISSEDIDGKYRLYVPEGIECMPLLIYLHGGGWCFGSINSCSRFCSSLAQEAGIAVLAVDYPLAPEHPYPAALNSCIEALTYVTDNASELGIDPNAISIGGDSAGGNLALATALRMIYTKEQLKDTPYADTLPKIKSLVLFYPVVKVWNDSSESWSKYESGYGLDGKIMETFNEAYIDGNDPQLPLISPYNAAPTHLSKLPPTLIVNADHDILKDQGETMCERLKEAGVEVNREVLPGTTHLFITVAGQPTAFDKSVALTKDFLSD